MNQSENVKELFEALVNARKDISNLYPSSSGYGYDYVPLEKIIDMLKNVLPNYGLSWIQFPSRGTDTTNVGITTRIIHKSGEWIEDSVVIPATEVKGTNASQKLGASVTYFRRYALCAAFGISGDKDVDANDKAFTESGSSASPADSQALKEASAILSENLNKGLLDSRPAWKSKALSLLKAKDLAGIIACNDYCKSLKTDKSA